MLVLSLDSSSIASAALSRDGEVMSRFDTTDTRSHAEVLAPAVQDLMTQAGVTGTDLDAVLVGTGPGPFTGLRAGLVTARTLGFAWGLPVHGMCSLDAVAFHVAPAALEAGHTEFVVVTDARRKELYRRSYRVRQDQGEPAITPLGDPRVGPPEEVPPLPSYGSGVGLYLDRLSYAVQDFTTLYPSAADLSRAAWELTSHGHQLSTDTSPLYLRESDAKVPASPKRATR